MFDRCHVTDFIGIGFPMQKARVRSTVPTGDEATIRRTEN